MHGLMQFSLQNSKESGRGLDLILKINIQSSQNNAKCKYNDPLISFEAFYSIWYFLAFGLVKNE